MKVTGLTLIEILMVLALLALSMALALPNVSRLLLNQQLRQQAQAFSNTLAFARSEAIRGERRVYLCAANLKRNLQLQGCATTAMGGNTIWTEGVLVYADRSGGQTAAYDSQERLYLLIFPVDKVQLYAPAMQLVLSPEGRILDGQTQTFYLISPSSGQCLTLWVSASLHSRQGDVRDQCL